jgi:Xaa-Pro aminopeptidase
MDVIAERRSAYQGDAILAGLLAQAGSVLTPAAVRELVRGVIAAPGSGRSGAWQALVAREPGPALAAQLEALRAETAAGVEKGAWSPERVARLRAAMAADGLAGFIVPRADEHQGEYVPRAAERLAWLTGFTGSAGMAIVLAERAAIFIDGRYTLQVKVQVDGALFEYRHLTEEPPHDWLAKNAQPGMRIGFDPWLHTVDGIARLRAAARDAGAELVAVADNPLDRAWSDRPAPPISPVVAHPAEFAGRSFADKTAVVTQRLAAERVGAAVLSAPDSIAWLLNVRGGDVPRTPLPLSFAIVNAAGEIDWFVDPRKLHPDLRAHLGNRVTVREPAALGAALDALGAAQPGTAKPRVLLDAATAAVWLSDRLEAAGAAVLRGQDPVALPKACKTAAELGHVRDAHLRDGAALTRFLHWVAREGARGAITELDAVEHLRALRSANAHYRDTSFDTISGAGPNGAIVHYRATRESNRPIAPDMLYLVDSGGQYWDGTTDVTRTVAIGTPSPEQRDRFTRVLKGHIALGLARFPTGTTGSQLDALARTALWEVGLDYDHGTGHGVGYYLSVHEGPHRISKMPNTVPLQPGMIVSNEPGYYKTGEYGIRIENLVAVEEVESSGERKLLGFETLTLAPIDRALVEPSLLSPRERDWLNAYHARVREVLTPLLDTETAGWLAEQTRAI